MMVSIVVPNRNKEQSLFHCLTALYRSDYGDFEVIVVDDGSEDDSVAIARRFPCRLVHLPVSVGAAEARNIGARRARGRILFFIDSDCVVASDTLTLLVKLFARCGKKAIVGGTYTERPFDTGFFSFFQSVLVHFSETKNQHPDYVATHALAMDAEQFRRSGGFARNFLPILEDVDFSHRMRRLGYRLFMGRKLQVRHDFRYGLWRSLVNGFTKARYWLVYSMGNKDLLADSGTASRELKTNLFCFVALFLLITAGTVVDICPWLPAGGVVAANLFSCRRLLFRFFSAGGCWFGLRACCYFLFFYPLAVWAGAGRGLSDAAVRWYRAFLQKAVTVPAKNDGITPILEPRK